MLTEKNFEKVKSALSSIENAIWDLERTDGNDVVISMLKTCAKDLHIKQANALLDSVTEKNNNPIDKF